MRLSCCTLTGLCVFVLMSGPAVAQDNAPGPAVVYVPAENVRLDYARVLNVEPVYQTLRASRSEMRCEEVATPKPPIKPEEEGRWVFSFSGPWKGANETFFEYARLVAQRT